MSKENNVLKSQENLKLVIDVLDKYFIEGSYEAVLDKDGKIISSKYISY
jgi:hypothetical protein